MSHGTRIPAALVFTITLGLTACASQSPNVIPGTSGENATSTAAAASSSQSAAPAMTQSTTRTAPMQSSSSATSSRPILNSAHPGDYTVVRGDTLWDISSRFLRDPWLWPEIWQVNPQIENPHLIYPGDVVSLIYVDGKPRLRVARAANATRLSPQIRATDLDTPITTIPYEVISAFLSKPTVVDRSEAERLPYIVAAEDGRIVAGAGIDVYARGLSDALEGSRFNVLHIGDKFRDPQNRRVLGYEALYVGEGRVDQGGDPAVMALTDSQREALRGDRLLPIGPSDIPMNFLPQAPSQQVEGAIVSVVDGISLIGPYQIVVINRGEPDGLTAGSVLAVYRRGQKVKDVWGRGIKKRVDLPNEHAGEIMVFRAFENISYALVMRASKDMHAADIVTNP